MALKDDRRAAVLGARRVGYVGKDHVSVGAAFAGVVHWERYPGSFSALCSASLTLSSAATPERLRSDRGYLIRKLTICKRCRRRLAQLPPKEQRID